MKIMTNDAVYVQKNDLIYVNQSDMAIPASIFTKVFGGGIVIIDDSNRYEFVKFEEEHEIEFFKNIDWINEYLELKDLTEEEIMNIGDSIIAEQNEIVDKYNAMSEEERKENRNMRERYEQLEFKWYSLRDILWFKQGHIEMELPEGIDYPIYYPQKRKGIKQLVNSIFRKITDKN